MNIVSKLMVSILVINFGQTQMFASQESINTPNQYGRLPLQQAVKNKKITEITRLIDAGADVNGTTEAEKNTPLIIAIASEDPSLRGDWKSRKYVKFKKQQSAIIKTLLARGADVEKPGSDEGKPLSFAVSHANIRAITSLIARGATIENRSLDYAIAEANSPYNPEYRKRQYAIARILQKAGATSQQILRPLPADKIMNEELHDYLKIK